MRVGVGVALPLAVTGIWAASGADGAEFMVDKGLGLSGRG